MILGIRPEDLEDAELEPDSPGDQTLDGEVELTEALGSEIMVHFSIDATAGDHGRGARARRRTPAPTGIGAPDAGGGRPHDHGRPLRRPLEGDEGRAASGSPSTRAPCTSSIRRRVSASTTEPKEREQTDDEATLHSARAARGRARVPRRRLRRRRRRGRRAPAARRPRKGAARRSPATSASSRCGRAPRARPSRPSSTASRRRTPTSRSATSRPASRRRCSRPLSRAATRRTSRRCRSPAS